MLLQCPFLSLISIIRIIFHSDDEAKNKTVISVMSFFKMIGSTVSFILIGIYTKYSNNPDVIGLTDLYWLYSRANHLSDHPDLGPL